MPNSLENVHRHPQHHGKMLQEDVAAMLRDTQQEYDRPEDAMELASDIITVVRERVLQEIISEVRKALIQVGLR